MRYSLVGNGHLVRYPSASFPSGLPRRIRRTACLTVSLVAADFSLRGRMAGGSQGDCRAAQPASLDLLDILDLLDFVFGFFYGSKSGVEIEDRYPGAGR